MAETATPTPIQNSRVHHPEGPAGYQSLTDAEQTQMVTGALKSLEQKHFGIALELVANTTLTEAQRKELRGQQTDLMDGIRKLRATYDGLLAVVSDGTEG